MLLTYDPEVQDGYELKFYLNGETARAEWRLLEVVSCYPMTMFGVWELVHLVIPMVGDSLVSWMIFACIRKHSVRKWHPVSATMASVLHGLTVEPFDFDPVQDPELQEEVSVEVKFKRYGGVVSL